MSEQVEYIHTKTITLPGMVAKIFQPVLTEEERQRRIEAIKIAAANLLRDVWENEKSI